MVVIFLPAAALAGKEHERAADRGDLGEEPAAVDVRELPHGVLSRAHAPAAAWIAALIR